MIKVKQMRKIQLELKKGMKLVKCRQCGCMKETLEYLRDFLSSIQTEIPLDLLKNIQILLEQMREVKYNCLGCNYCFPAVAMNMFWKLFPEVTYIPSLNCASQVKKQNWPVVPGEYFAFCDGSDCPVAVSTLASVELAEKLASLRPKGLCIVGKTETENIGIEKVIKNTITNPTIHFLILAGKDPKGHHSGQTLLALYENGIDDNMKVIGSLGKRPILKNVSFVEVEKFRKQVQVINIIGCEDIKKIIDKIEELSREATSTCECKECSELMSIVRTPSVPKILASKPKKLKMDKAPGKEVKTK